MKFKKSDILTSDERLQILNLWNEEYPQSISLLNLDGFDTYLANLKDKHHLLVSNDVDGIIGWYIDFIRDEERWFAMIVDHKYQGKGIGRQLIGMAKETNEVLNGWVILRDDYKKRNGEAYLSPISFYRKNNFEIIPYIKLETDSLTAIKMFWEKKKKE